MTMVRQILCATDLSEASAAAWEEAQLLGRLSHAELLLLHVVAPIVFPGEGYFPPQAYQEWVDAVHREAHDGMDRLLEKVTGPLLKVRSRVEQGTPAERILQVAREEGANLIVMGTHGRTGLPRLLLGSVADRVVRQATCPVITVPARPGAPAAARPRIARICYATDFSPTARAAWPWVLALADAAGAEVDLLHVTLSPVAERHLSAELIGETARLLREQGQAEAEGFLRRSPLPRERVSVLIGQGVVGDQIVHWARARAADLIVMGTHGWSGLVRWMLGSVAHHVVQTAPCPVLTVGPTSQDEERRHAN